jgi:hypothetical protein
MSSVSAIANVSAVDWLNHRVAQGDNECVRGGRRREIDVAADRCPGSEALDRGPWNGGPGTGALERGPWNGGPGTGALERGPWIGGPGTNVVTQRCHINRVGIGGVDRKRRETIPTGRAGSRVAATQPNSSHVRPGVTWSQLQILSARPCQRVLLEPSDALDWVWPNVLTQTRNLRALEVGLLANGDEQRSGTFSVEVISGIRHRRPGPCGREWT